MRVTGGRLLVVRHRQSTWNAERRWAGQADPPLSPHGEWEAAGLGERLSGVVFDAVVSSDLRRARQTAAGAAAGRAGIPVVSDPGLREVDAGLWSGRTREDIEARWPGLLDRWRSGEPLDLPGGEPWAEFETRTLAALDRCAARWSRALVVAHAGTLRVLGAAPGARHTARGRAVGVWVARVRGALVVEGTLDLRRAEAP
jgi:broad specificity phosphatase PhoE